MYTGKSIPVHVGSIKLHTLIKFGNKSQDNKYQGKDDQNCMFGSVP